MKASTTSTGVDREQRREQHARRVAALRAQRQRPGRTGAAAQLDDPFGVVQPDRELNAAEAAFPC
jgi:hypothetical protein